MCADLLLLGLLRRHGALDRERSQRQVRGIISLRAAAFRPLACAGAPLGHGPHGTCTDKLAEHARGLCAAAALQRRPNPARASGHESMFILFHSSVLFARAVTLHSMHGLTCLPMWKMQNAFQNRTKSFDAEE